MDNFKQWLENQADIMGAGVGVPALIGGGGQGGGIEGFGQKEFLPRKKFKLPPLGNIGSKHTPIKIFKPSKELMINPT
jgi:hypothetical protein